LSVVTRGYFVINGKPKLVSEGLWIWHPGEKKLKGYFTAIEFPVVFFDYTTSIEKNKIVSCIKTYSSQGTEDNFTDIYEFTDDDHYKWTLLHKTPEGDKKVNGGNFTRKYSKGN